MSEVHLIKDWVQAALTGDQPAWTSLHHVYYPSLYSLALRTCNDPQLAKDMVQETFITAYLKLPQLKNYEAFGGWIKTVLLRACYRALNQARSDNNLADISFVNSHGWEDEINQGLDRIATTGRLYAAVATLPETLRSTLLLRYFSTFSSYEDIATILSIPVGTVRSRLNQAKTILARQWRQHAETDTKIFKEGEEWNRFYHATFSGIHHVDDCKNRFIRHLKKDMQIVLPGGKTNVGRQFFEYKIHDDLRAGSWCQASDVYSSGNISIIETNHFNSPEHPDHCPVSSVVVLYRDKGTATRMNLHVPCL